MAGSQDSNRRVPPIENGGPMRFVFVVSAFLISTLGLAQGPVPPAAVTDVRIAATTATPAVCTSGRGNSTAYAEGMTRLFAYVLSQNITAQGFFSSTWEGGTQAVDGSDAQWDVCAAVGAKPSTDVAAPFVYREVPPQEAVHALCALPVENLGQCFTALTAYATAQQRIPAAPPRYNVLSGPPNPKYEVWLPLRPVAPPAPPAAPPAPAPAPPAQGQR